MYIQYSAPTNVDTTQLWRELNNFCAVTRIQFIQELQPKTNSKFSIRKLYSIFEVPDIFLKHFLGPKISLISIEFKPRKCSVELKINLLKQRDLNIILNRSNHLFWSQTWMLCKHACYHCYSMYTIQVSGNKEQAPCSDATHHNAGKQSQSCIKMIITG